MKRMLSILLMLMLVPCAALAEEEYDPVTPMLELTMAHGFRFGGHSTVGRGTVFWFIMTDAEETSA